jgi:hypothetical protein
MYIRKEMKCLICDEDLADRDFSTHIVTKHDGHHNPWKYIMIIQKRLERIEHNIEKSHGPMD